jgi:3-phytase
LAVPRFFGYRCLLAPPAVLARTTCLIVVAIAAGCIWRGRPAFAPKPPSAVGTVTFAGEFSLPPLDRFPPLIGLPFCGISGLAPANPATSALWGISDARDGGRIYQLDIQFSGGALRVIPSNLVPLEMTMGIVDRDPEAIALEPNGNFLVASEGISASEPRVPPSIVEYGRRGEFVRALEVRARFAPEPKGPQTRGVRPNAGFESLTITPNGGRLFTATETALVQDGPAATFEAGAMARILEYSESNGTYVPSREFVYPLDPLPRPAFTPGFFINGLVELLALGHSTLLALERGYAEEGPPSDRNVTTIRLYRVSLDGATDVSRLESLQGQSGIVPVTKTRLLDLSEVKGLSPALAAALDNFEGMALGPRLPDGRASLILVSDDNFNTAQRTWFLLFAIQ